MELQSNSGLNAGPHSQYQQSQHASQHPIEGLMKTAMESIKGMIDVNTVVGQPVETHDGGTIIPISRVSFGFAAGGGEFWNQETSDGAKPFGGGSGAGVTVHPVGFLVVQGDQVRLMSVDRGDVMESLVNSAPQLLEQVQEFFGKRSDSEAGVTNLLRPNPLT